MKDENMHTKSSVSNAETYQEIGSFWDEHDATEFGEETHAEFDVKIKFQRRCGVRGRASASL
jgi:hypothetical protein